MPREIPLTREDMYGWVQAWKQASNLGTLPPMDEWIRGKLETELVPELASRELQVPSPEGSSFTTVDVVDYIMEDLASYLPPEVNG